MKERIQMTVEKRKGTDPAGSEKSRECVDCGSEVSSASSSPCPTPPESDAVATLRGAGPSDGAASSE